MVPPVVRGIGICTLADIVHGARLSPTQAAHDGLM